MKRILLMISLLVLLSVSGHFTYISAQKQPTIQSLNDQIARMEEEIRRNETLLGKIKKDQKLTQNELKLVRSRINNRKELVATLRSQITLREKDIASKNGEIAGLEKTIAKLKKEYAEMVYAAYKNHILNNSMAFIFASQDFNDATRRIDYMRRYNNMRETKAAQLDSLTKGLQNEITLLAEQKAELEVTRQDRDKELKALQTDETAYKKSSTKLASDEKKISTQIKQKENEKKKAQQQLQKLIEEEARKAAAKKHTAAEQRQIAELSNNFEQNEGKFPYPVNGGVIVDRFGKHPHPTQKGLTIDNKGVNIAAEGGAAVRAIFEGTVSRVVFIKGLNNCVMINHGNYFTVYSNLADVTVKANDAVSRNQVLGHLPSTGDNNDYYLHFELWRGTTYLNPERWFAR